MVSKRIVCFNSFIWKIVMGTIFKDFSRLQLNMGDGNMSVPLYNYLCSKLGHENDVRTRRLCYSMSEYICPNNNVIPSGSKAEGLDFIESDLDIMFLLTYVHVFELRIHNMLPDSFIIHTEDTAPGLIASFKLKSNKFLYSTLTSMLAKHTSCRGTNIWELTNKYFYKTHKNKMPYLRIGLQCDAMSGWLNLATYFYCMKQYRISFCLTVLTLSKCHSNEILSFKCMDVGFGRIISNVEHEAIEYGFINAFHICKRRLTSDVEFSILSCIYPFELEMEVRIRTLIHKSPILYGFFLRFLCFHHLHEHTDVTYALQDLYNLTNYLTRDSDHLDWNIFMGQAHFALGNFRTALTFFKNVSELEGLCSIFTGFNPLQYKAFAEFMINHIQLKL
ncbi:unnamed protein product [Mytilus edulis]|uniref:Uncharacterized protein n=1 Tax=Mytilus edulis TaxID=6550 RepID=A0A8S3Q7E3_MYTED|nr:unnamed protein product [Mytilus edulis]